MNHFKEMDLTEVRPYLIKNNRKIEYLNTPCAFDIETTSIIEQGVKVGFMYIWQFGIQDSEHIYYGRTWEEFINICGRLQYEYNLDENRRLICYVHNLSYEFQFMRKYFHWLDIFAISERKPIKALTSFGIEFRDSYILSGYSLANTAKNLHNHTIEKLEGDLDYSLIRHYETKLTEIELGYCKNDIDIILCYIREQIDLYGTIERIPLTNTGRVRKFVSNNCFHGAKNHRKDKSGKYNKFKKIMNDLVLTPETYKTLKQGFQGGFTHANANYVGEILEEVTSIDFSSSYPYVMVSEKFPMSEPIEINVYDKDFDLEKYINNYNCIFEIMFEDLQATFHNDNYISEHKCIILKKPIVNNGRISSAQQLAMVVTELDFKIIKAVYEWSNISIRKFYIFQKAYLPKPIIESIIDLYKDKTELKDVKGKEVEYMLSKGMLNSVYGMSVTDIVRDENNYTNHVWQKEKSDIEEEINKYNGQVKRFLYYPWGVWVTAYARYNLWMGILNINNDYVYADTDSIKLLNYDKHIKFIESYNKMCHFKIFKMCDYYNIDASRLSPKNIKGIIKPIGIWDYEGTYTHFKTLGAKRYMNSYDDNVTITVAGLPKKAGIEYLKKKHNNVIKNIFNDFNNKLYIPSSETGKMTHTYIDDEIDLQVTDYLGNKTDVHVKSGIHLEDCDFTLNQSESYLKFLNEYVNGLVYKGLKVL